MAVFQRVETVCAIPSLADYLVDWTVWEWFLGRQSCPVNHNMMIVDYDDAKYPHLLDSSSSGS